MPNYEKVEKEIAEGRLWRAKEMLQGGVKHGYDTELLERYGRLLLQMRDDLEAGRYLFLSGVRKEEYQEAISLFLSKYKSKNIDGVWNAFPKGVRDTGYEDYPENVINELEVLGFRKRSVQNVLNTYQENDSESGGGQVDWIFLTVIVLAVGFLVQSVLGLIHLVEWLTE